MVWTLRFGSVGLHFHQDKASARRRALSSQDAAHLDDWAERYGRAINARNADELLTIGREIFGWLEADGHGWGALLIGGTGEISLDVVVDENPSVEARAFLNVPWELLATTTTGGYLAEDALRAYCVQRRLGEARAPTPPQFQDLAVMFMAAAPRDVDPVLDFEAEEAGILDATAGLPLALTVEESGCPTFLKNRLADEGPFDIVHLTCHGAIGENGPMLALEEEAGDLADTSAAMLSDALGKDKPSLTFLSACRTAENVDHAAPLAVSLLQAGVPAVLGWDGSVHDDDASHFARELYAELANHDRPALAVAKARQQLLASHRADPLKGQHWHLARLYVAPEGGGRLCEQNAEARPKHRGLAYNTFLDKERQRVPVAGASAFVGRRRALQDVFRAFRANTPGVLIHGFGGHGKSSLAARVADRCPRHKTALVFEFYDAGKVFDAALKAVPGGERQVLRDTWSAVIANDPSTLRKALKTILTGPCAAYELNGSRIVRQPLLLVIDDLERILETPAVGDDAKAAADAEHKPVLGAVLEAFGETAGVTQSRLLLTSRYDFALRDASGADLAGPLARVSLRPFDDLEQQKQQSAAARGLGGVLSSEDDMEEREDLLAHCRAAAEGNPLVQATLTRTALAEPAAAEAALAKLEAYKSNGTAPSEGELADVFKRLAFKVYREALSMEEAEAFRALMLFELPVPESACRAAAALLAHEAAEAAFTRFTSLGLIDGFEAYTRGSEAELLANALARPHFATLTEDERRALAKAALPPLIASWCDEDGNLPHDQRSIEAFRLSKLARDTESLNKAALAGGGWLLEAQHDARGALGMMLAARLVLTETHQSPTPSLLLIGIRATGRLGETMLQDELLAEADDIKGIDTYSQALLWGLKADRLMQRGELDEALRILREEELPVYDRLGYVHERVVTMGNIAKIFEIRGEFDEALRIRREVQLPVYDKLGDVRGLADTMGQIAEILEIRGELDEALRIRREEQLPVYDKLGYLHERALTMGQIADILFRRGELDEALRIRQEEQLPVYENLGYVIERTVTRGQIADMLEARGELDEALRIRREEELPVYERLGDMRSRAVTMSKIADVLYRRGEFDEALRIRRQEVLPVFNRIGDTRSRAATMGRIADILFDCGELDEALRIRREEELPVYERLGDMRSRAVTMGEIANILQARDEFDEALRIRQEEQIPVFEKLGDMRERAVTMGKIADILYARSEIDEALRIYEEEYLPTAEQLNDVESIVEGIVRISLIKLNKGINSEDSFNLVRGELTRAYGLAKKLTRTDFICATSATLGGLLVAAKAAFEARPFFAEARDGYRKLGWVQEAVQMETQLAQLDSSDGYNDGGQDDA